MVESIATQKKTDYVELVQTLRQLGDHQHLKRERAIRQYVKLLKENEDEEKVSQVSIEVFKLMFTSKRWEDRYGAINGVTELVNHNKDQTLVSDFMWTYIVNNQFAQLMVDSEFRVRNQTGALIKTIMLSDQKGKASAVFDTLKDLLIQNIESTFERDTSGDASGSLANIKPDSATGKTMHDTEGWKSLETSMRTLQNIIEGIGTNLYQFNLDKVLAVIEKAIAHLNRFVREISYFVINAIFETSVGVQDTEHWACFQAFCEKLVPLVSFGVSDNWSQVRYASSLCTRSFYLVVKHSPEIMDKYNPELVPKMCLNRYYVAEGVRVYSIETWRLIFGEQGKHIVCKYADEVSKFYISQSQADNHAVREAACHCISELCTKVAAESDANKESFRPHIDQLLSALVDCFKDESWPVRDAACVACGSFVGTFAEESKAKYEELCEIWFAHLSDNIFSVRHHSALALCTVYKLAPVYQEDLYKRFDAHLTANLMKAKEQKSTSESFSNLKNETQFGVAKGKAFEVDAEHQDKTMYSCGSLAPKLKRGGGCMDHGFTRAMEAWEMSDGSVYLIRELSQIKQEPAATQALKLVTKHLMSLADLGFVDHFKHAASLNENLFKSLAIIISPEGIGKKKFRGFVELFLDPAFRNGKNNTQNCALSAQDFLLALNKTYGENIFRAILENHDQRYVTEFENYKREAQMGGAQQDFIYPPNPFGKQAVNPANPFGARLPNQPGPGFPPSKAPFSRVTSDPAERKIGQNQKMIDESNL